MLVLTVALFVAWTSLLRRPDRWARVLSERFWRRCMAWTIILTMAAAVGAVAGGGSLVPPVVAVGSACLLFAAAMWINAR